MIASVKERHASVKLHYFISPEVLEQIYKEIGVPFTATQGKKTNEEEGTGSEQEGEVMDEEIEAVDDDDDDIYM